MPDPIEKTTRYATTVDTLTEAWAFLLDRIDAIGPDPSVTIRPISTIGVADMAAGLEGSDDGAWVRRFEVVVEGMVREPAEGGE